MKGIYFMLFFSFGSLIFADENSAYHFINPSNDELVKSISRGKEVYADFCMQCHLGNGKGSETVPPLAASDWLVNKRKESIHAVKYGQSGPIKVNGKSYNGRMSPMGLSDDEVADVMNYIMNSWGNKQSKMVTVSEVKAVKK
ncbi:MAG TPA: cytochrome c [Flavobacterium sp.]|uniref:c-type cytochrome n=1 Tax=unclassified Flavobacterium TaxID=196869 RepID=UPI000E8AFF49|nr:MULTISPECIES: cytochrome c [unclassified Flavobacterium]HBI02006.1 cytochrome C [Flavobacterium sp.]HRE77173.1 cytochrome c [Flavobacterium sp.]